MRPREDVDFYSVADVGQSPGSLHLWIKRRWQMSFQSWQMGKQTNKSFPQFGDGEAWIFQAGADREQTNS